MRSASALTIALAIALAAEAGLSAHRLDELLQAARIGIDENRVELQLDLTPGVAAAEAIIADIDSDRDGSFSASEQRAYVSRVLETIHLAADGRRLSMSLDSFTFPAIDAIREGVGAIAIRATAPMDALPGAHTIALTNAYKPEGSVYLANALVPDSNRIAVHTQRRDGNQHQLSIDFSVATRRGLQPAAAAMSLLGIVLGVAVIGGKRVTAARL